MEYEDSGLHLWGTLCRRLYSCEIKAAPGEKPAAVADKEPHDRGLLWVEDNGFVKPVKVRIGLSDGLQTEIVKGDVQEGAAVVVGESRPSSDNGNSNPFAPKLFSGGGNKQQ